MLQDRVAGDSKGCKNPSHVYTNRLLQDRHRSAMRTRSHFQETLGALRSAQHSPLPLPAGWSRWSSGLAVCPRSASWSNRQQTCHPCGDRRSTRCSCVPLFPLQMVPCPRGIDFARMRFSRAEALASTQIISLAPVASLVPRLWFAQWVLFRFALHCVVTDSPGTGSVGDSGRWIPWGGLYDMARAFWPTWANMLGEPCQTANPRMRASKARTAA